MGMPLFCIAGKSSSGKDTIVCELCKRNNWKQVTSYATRERRQNEGYTHIFIKDEEVEQYQNDFSAYTRIGSFQYFTTKTQLKDPSIKFYIIDPNGIKWLKENFKDRPIYVIYIAVSDKLAQQRALFRGDSLDVYQKRHADENEQFARFEALHEWDIIVHNEASLESAINDVYWAVILAEKEDG